MAGKGPQKKTGERCEIARRSQMVLPWIVVRSVSESNLVTDTSDPELKEKEFKPAGGFPENERKWALTAIDAAPTAEPNLRRIFYVKFSKKSDAAASEIRVVHEVRNGNTCKWEISSFGKPASKLPDAATASSIETRLKKNRIEKGTGAWKGNEWSSVLAALGRLTDTEMERIAGVGIRRDAAGSNPKAGGNYSQKDHVIHLYDEGMKDCEAMALGTKPATMLPASGHAVLHEVGHAIAYARIRLAGDERNKKGRALMRKWGEAAFLFTLRWEGEKEICSSEKNEAFVSKDLSDFRAEVKDFEKSFDDANKASPVVPNFQKVVKARKLVEVTPQAKENMEEFFVESFSLWKWYREWLQQHRKAIHDFFSANKHLV